MAAGPNPTTAPLEAYVREAAAAAGLNLNAQQLAGVVEAYVRMASFGNLIMDFPLDETDEPAPVYVP